MTKIWSMTSTKLIQETFGFWYVIYKAENCLINYRLSTNYLINISCNYYMILLMYLFRLYFRDPLWGCSIWSYQQTLSYQGLGRLVCVLFNWKNKTQQRVKSGDCLSGTVFAGLFQKIPYWDHFYLVFT